METLGFDGGQSWLMWGLADTWPSVIPVSFITSSFEEYGGDKMRAPLHLSWIGLGGWGIGGEWWVTVCLICQQWFMDGTTCKD